MSLLEEYHMAWLENYTHLWVGKRKNTVQQMDVGDRGDRFYKVRMYLHEVGGVSFLKIPAVLLCVYALK